MALNKKPYKGCRDFYPEDMRIQNYLFDKMRETAESFGYLAYDGPMLEEVELYKAKSGEELINDQIYSFTDRGERNVAIRPEMTPTLARMVANIHKQAAKPLRWYAIPNLMRYEKPQRGRVREHWQFNVDIFGATENLGEIEILTLAVSFLKSLGATNKMFSILINDREIVDAVFNDLLKLNAEDSYKLYKVIDNAKKVTAEKLDAMISEIIQENESKKLIKEYLAATSFAAIQEFLEKNNIQDKCGRFKQFIHKIDKLELKDAIQYDPTIVRGLDYYTGIVFEVFDNNPENRRAIAGGGAYANLLSIFNESQLSGVGFGLGDVTLKDFLEVHKLLPSFDKSEHDIFLCYTDDAHEAESFNYAEALRANGLKVELNLGKIKFNKIFKLAETKKQVHAAIVEEKDGKLQVQAKNLETRVGQFFDLNQINELKSFIK